MVQQGASAARTGSYVLKVLNPRKRYSTRGSASAKLYADAEREESIEKLTNRQKPERSRPEEFPNWTGEERIQDTVLRMLMDKYKPLRTGTIQSADSKLKEMNAKQPNLLRPQILSQASTAEMPSSAEQVLPLQTHSLPVSGDEHKPWLVTFKPPSHTNLAQTIKYGHAAPPRSQSASIPISAIEDPKARAEARRQRKLALDTLRLTQARESTLDYKLGVSADSPSSPLQSQLGRQHEPTAEGPQKQDSSRTSSFRNTNPVSLRAWSSLIEDKIERARAKGQFDNLTGRGKPLARDDAEGNPFIAREEYLMNRIVRRNGAAPPWVEIQQEVNTSLANFRSLIRDTWVRRAIRTLTLDRHPSTLSSVSEAAISDIRDLEWEARESKYHEHLITEVNSVIRKYNNAAPYAVRKPYIQLRAELDDCYQSAAPVIVQELRDRASGKYNGADMTRLLFTPQASGGVRGSNANASMKVFEKPAAPLFAWKFSDLLRKLGLRNKGVQVDS